MLIREDDAYNNNRLTPIALRELYEDLVTSERERRSKSQKLLNGHVAADGSSSRKRKLAASSPSADESPQDENLIADLVARLYADFKEHTINEIRSEEVACKKLQEEVDGLASEPSIEELPAQNGNVGLAHESRGSVESEERSPGMRPDVPKLPTPTPVSLPDRDGSSVGNEPVPSLPPARIGSKPAAQVTEPSPKRPPKATSEDANPSISAAQRMPAPPSRGPGDGNNYRSMSTSSANGQIQAALPLPVSYPSPSGLHLNRSLPPLAQASQQPRFGVAPPPQPFHQSSPRSPVILPPPPGVMSPMRPPVEMPGSYRRTSSGSDQVHGSPLPLINSPHFPHYPPPPPYNYPQPLWPHVQYPPQQYQPHASPYPNPQFFSPSVGARSPHVSPSPAHHQYQHQPQSTPPQTFQKIPHHRPGPYTTAPHLGPRSWPAQFGSARSTPSNKRRRRPPFVGISGSSTPWTPRTTQARPIRHASPERPNRDISPFSDRNSPDVEDSNKVDIGSPKEAPAKATLKPLESIPSRELKSETLQPVRTGRSLKRMRAASTASSALASKSRSQSVASFTSETPRDRRPGRQIRRIKREPPSTPAAIPSDSDQQRSSDRRRGRADTIQSQSEALSSLSKRKRKRESTHDTLASPSLNTQRTSLLRFRHRPGPVDPSLVAASKNFARVAGPIMNDIAAHKHAGIFAKPLTEREAPGYKDLVYQPQDLKSIKAAVNRGSRAANASIEEMTSADAAAAADDGSATLHKGSIGSGMVLLKKTDELIPPKGIVNSSQLELELIRMFANATMFNPLPTTERGFGPKFKMRRNGESGAKLQPDSQDSESGEDEEEREENVNKGYVYAEVEEGGIIHDTRDMFESVERALGNWRSVEQGFGVGMFDDVPRSGGLGGVIGGPIRGSSVSDAVADESAHEEAEEKETGDVGGGGAGTARKRRRTIAVSTAAAADTATSG